MTLSAARHLPAARHGGDLFSRQRHGLKEYAARNEIRQGGTHVSRLLTNCLAAIIGAAVFGDSPTNPTASR